MTTPILWKDHGRQNNLTDDACIILLHVILLHFSKESGDKLKAQGIDLLIEIYPRPLFNYISFWKYLDLYFLERIMNVFIVGLLEYSKLSIFKNEVLKLFINHDKKINSLSIPGSFYPNLFSKIEHCFSELEYFYCDNNINYNILESVMSTRIKKLELNVKYGYTTNPNIFKLIEAQKNLEVNLIYDIDIVICNLGLIKIEESLIKCADTVQYLRIDWEPITQFLVNLVSLGLSYVYFGHNNLIQLENLSFPLLKILKSWRHFI
ncbi:hypothetical protein RclHR1_04590015 [Rhizophagus clarus]|uniref:Uncharacterized protein n=1 Tax=Rhizophagus clarus TaxID=94130 RepID=A0A2Z6S0Q2_9GLOM|nr:hypothetical protein RclHR1_04590015 [Rhizophagus clarus]GES83903.1 hypothetical protein GLOIN_2v1884233 [Rhizophagus clarus]